MTRPPLTTPLTLALRSVLTASIDQASRLGLLATLCPATAPSSPPPVLSFAPPLAEEPAPARLPSAATRVIRAAGHQAGPVAGMATVLTMPRVIPMPRPAADDPEPDPSAA